MFGQLVDEVRGAHVDLAADGDQRCRSRTPQRHRHDRFADRSAADHVPDLIPYDARAKKVLELTFREALRLGHNYVGTEHVLLALPTIDPPRHFDRFGPRDSAQPRRVTGSTMRSM